MSAIDNAFIRAYTTDAAPLAGSTVAAVRTKPIAAPTAVAVSTVAPSAAAKTAALQSATAAGLPKKSGGPHFTPALPRENTANSVIPAPHINLASFAHSVTTLDSPVRAAPIPVRIDPPAIASFTPHTISTMANASFVETRIADVPIDDAPIDEMPLDETEFAESLPLKPIAAAAPTKLAPQRPAFEVDRLTWPETCGALLARIGTQVDELCQELMAEASLGRKVIAISGCSRSAGGTTLALVLGRRLAAAGAKVALVDADFAAPQLAGQLGLVIGIGWETVLALPEKTALWEAMVESLEDRLTVVPLASRSRLNVSGEIATRLTECLGQLRDAYEIVLVDVGAVSAGDMQNNWLSTPGSGLDAAILVSDTRSTEASRLATLNRRLMDANIAPLGIAENFCV